MDFIQIFMFNKDLDGLKNFRKNIEKRYSYEAVMAMEVVGWVAFYDVSSIVGCLMQIFFIYLH